MQAVAPTAQSGLDSRMNQHDHTALLTFISVAERTLAWRFAPPLRGHGEFCVVDFPLLGLRAIWNWACRRAWSAFASDMKSG